MLLSFGLVLAALPVCIESNNKLTSTTGGNHRKNLRGDWQSRRRFGEPPLLSYRSPFVEQVTVFSFTAPGQKLNVPKKLRGSYSFDRESEVVPVTPLVADFVGIETNCEGRAVRQVSENACYRCLGGVFKHRQHSPRPEHAMMLVNQKGK